MAIKSTTTGVLNAAKGLVKATATIVGGVIDITAAAGHTLESTGYVNHKASLRQHGLVGWAEGKRYSQSTVESMFVKSEPKPVAADAK